MMIGAAAQRRPREAPTTEFDYALMRDAGIGWVRLGFRAPFADETMTATTAEFQAQEREVERIASHGLKLMAYTPFPGGDPDIGGHYPAWGGPPGGEGYLAHYEAVCAWLAERFRGVADAWQIANELNLPFWAGDLSPDQAVAFLQHGGRGVKRGHPEALVGFNMAGFGETAMAMYAQLFGPPPRRRRDRVRLCRLRRLHGAGSLAGQVCPTQGDHRQADRRPGVRLRVGRDHPQRRADPRPSFHRRPRSLPLARLAPLLGGPRPHPRRPGGVRGTLPGTVRRRTTGQRRLHLAVGRRAPVLALRPTEQPLPRHRPLGLGRRGGTAETRPRRVPHPRRPPPGPRERRIDR